MISMSKRESYHMTLDKHLVEDHVDEKIEDLDSDISRSRYIENLIREDKAREEERPDSVEEAIMRWFITGEWVAPEPGDHA